MMPPRSCHAPMYLVSECTTMSAPCSIGLHRMGSGHGVIHDEWNALGIAILAMAARSIILPAGFPMLSQYTVEVFSSINAARDSGVVFANRTSIPLTGKTCGGTRCTCRRRAGAL